MKSSNLYCLKKRTHDGRGIFTHFFPGVMSVRACMGRDTETIYRVIVREATGDDVPNYWSWWSNEREEFCFTNENRVGVDICFPYGPEIEEKKGRGQLMSVVVEVLGEFEEMGVM